MKVGEYELQGEIGRGGVGVVFRARAPDGSTVALKLLHRVSVAALARFERERALTAALGEGDGFVPLIDQGGSADGPYFVMPFLDGGTLRERLGRGPLGIAETVALGRELARAIGRAHERGIVHRDLKPENILFVERGARAGEGGRALIADLGIAMGIGELARYSSGRLPAAGSRSLGSVGYMPPEQMESPGEVGPEADVFALGAILWECLAGRPAFQGENKAEVALLAAAASPPSLASLREGIPPFVARAVERALAARARERFANGAELARALEEGTVPPDPPPSPVHVAARAEVATDVDAPAHTEPPEAEPVQAPARSGAVAAVVVVVAVLVLIALAVVAHGR